MSTPEEFQAMKCLPLRNPGHEMSTGTPEEFYSTPEEFQGPR